MFDDLPPPLNLPRDQKKKFPLWTILLIVSIFSLCMCGTFFNDMSFEMKNTIQDQNSQIQSIPTTISTFSSKSKR